MTQVSDKDSQLLKLSFSDIVLNVPYLGSNLGIPYGSLSTVRNVEPGGAPKHQRCAPPKGSLQIIKIAIKFYVLH